MWAWFMVPPPAAIGVAIGLWCARGDDSAAKVCRGTAAIAGLLAAAGALAYLTMSAWQVGFQGAAVALMP